jgi:hypothetical protein
MILDARPVSEIVATVGIAREELRAWRRDPVVAGVISELQVERRRLMLDTVDAAVPEAVEALRRIIRFERLPEGVSGKTVVSAAVAILDRGGLPRVERVEHGSAEDDPNADLDLMTPEELAAEEMRLRRLRDVG